MPVTLSGVGRSPLLHEGPFGGLQSKHGGSADDLILRAGLAGVILLGDGPDVIVRSNERGVILYASATCGVLGYKPEELVGRSGLELVHPDDLSRFAENTASLYRNGAQLRASGRVHRFKRKDGSWMWLRGNPSMLPSREGPRSEVLNFFQPITGEAAAQALTAAANRRPGA
jgi:PAS domain S-box-containing protein